MKAKALKAASVKKYNAIAQSCMNVQKDVYHTLVENRMGFSYIDENMGCYLKPTAWIENLPHAFNALNTYIVNYNLNINQFQAPSKLKPVIIVYPCEDVTPKPKDD